MKSIAWLLMLGTSTSVLAADSVTNIANTRSTVAKWIATQDLIFKERKDWEEEQYLLRARIEAITKEIAAAESKLGESRRILAEMRTKKAEAETIEDELSARTQRLAAAVSALEGDVRRLQALLPTTVQQKVEPLYRRTRRTRPPRACRWASASRTSSESSMKFTTPTEKSAW